MSPGPVQCRCPVSTVDRTGITLTACLKYMAYWQKIHISSRVSLFSISQNRTKPQIPLGGTFGVLSQWLRSDIFVCRTWRLLSPAWWAGMLLCSRQSYWGTGWGLWGSWGAKDCCGTAHVLTWFWGFFWFFLFAFVWHFFHPLTLFLL